jgi:L-threonylcarbamoyladenylate synthase
MKNKPPPGPTGLDLIQLQASFNASALLAYPTEAVWGLGCNPNNDAALQRLLRLKQRPWQKGLVVVAADFSQLQPWLLPLAAADEARVLASWPGPVTWALPCQPDVSRWLRGEHDTLAVRVSAHPVVQQLCRQLGPLVSTSANPAGEAPARTLAQVQQYFGTAVTYAHGDVGGRILPSEIHTLDGRRVR